MHAFRNRFAPLLSAAAVLAALSALAPGTAWGAARLDHTLRDGGQEATFNPRDELVHGLTSWTIDGNNFLGNRQYFIRRGDARFRTEERLGFFFESATQPTDNRLTAKYRVPDVESNSIDGGLKAEADYRLDAISGRESRIEESLAITSETYEGTFDLFVLSNFKIARRGADDISRSGSDTGTASLDGGRSHEGSLFAEYLQPRAKLLGDGPSGFRGPDRFEIDEYQDLLVTLIDGTARDLRYTEGEVTLAPDDLRGVTTVAFAHQFSFDLEPGQKILVRGTSSAAAPAPSAVSGGLVLLGGLAIRGRRRRRRHQTSR